MKVCCTMKPARACISMRHHWKHASAGQEISATEFEKIGGKASSKKWRNSLRVQRPDGRSGPCVGDWLMVRALHAWLHFPRMQLQPWERVIDVASCIRRSMAWTTQSLGSRARLMAR